MEKYNYVHLVHKNPYVLSLFFLSLVAQLAEALRYKPEGRGFDSRWCHWNF
jgi:hypothetical protein